MRRVSVVGSSGSGKTTVGRALAEILEVPFTELDSVHHLADWATIDSEAFTRRAEEVTSGDSWVVDGNYSAVVTDGPVWERADTVVWLDVPKPVAMWQVSKRTISRAITREELWHGNREQWSGVFSWNPERSMIRWVWTTHGRVRERYERLSCDPEFGHLAFIQLRSRSEIGSFLADLSRRCGPRSTG